MLKELKETRYKELKEIRRMKIGNINEEIEIRERKQISAGRIKSQCT